MPVHNTQQWNQPKCASADEAINAMRCIYAIEYYLAI